MSQTIEIERTFILNSVPKDLSQFTKKYLMDIYLPPSSDNPQIRLRQVDDKYYLTKKYPKNPIDLSTMVEETIILAESEFSYFKKNLLGRVLEKTRYTQIADNYQIDLDVYMSNLEPLIILDIELNNIDLEIREVLENFDISTEVTNNKNYAGGRMAGKIYNEVVTATL